MAEKKEMNDVVKKRWKKERKKERKMQEVKYFYSVKKEKNDWNYCNIFNNFHYFLNHIITQK